jgi:Kef-type K+ transport system membrane component KefB
VTDPGELAARTFLALAVVLVVARVVGSLFRRVGQPAVIGEIVAGIALGPSLLGLLPGDLPAVLFPLEIRPYLRILSEFGLVIFMFLIGLEIDPKVLRSNGRRAATVSLSSILLSFVLGTVVLGPLLHPDHDVVGGKAVGFIGFATFIGVCICGTAFPILARVLTDRGLFRIPLGMMLVSSAAIDDVVTFAILTGVLAIATAGGLASVPVTLGGLALIIGSLFLVGRPLLRRTIAVAFDRDGLTLGIQAVAVIGLMVSVFATEFIGLALLLGAFLFGASFPRGTDGRLAAALQERFEPVATGLLLPVFFVVTGLGVDVKGLGAQNVLPALAVLLVASAGKLVGGATAARVTGVRGRQCLAVGVLVNTRGLAELVIMRIGLTVGVFDEQVFTMLVLAALTTTVMAGPLLRLVYPDRILQRDIAEAERARAARARGYRVHVVTSRPEDVGPLSGLATALGSRDTVVTLLQPASAPLSGTLEALRVADEARRAGLDGGVPVNVTSRRSADPTADSAAAVGEAGADLVLVRFPDPGSDYETQRAMVDAVLAHSTADVAVIARPPETWSPASIAVTSSGTDAAAEFAVRAIRGFGGSLSVTGGGRSAVQVTTAFERAGVTVVPTHGEPDVRIEPLSEGIDAKVERELLGTRQPLVVVRSSFGERGPLAELSLANRTAQASEEGKAS